MKKKYQKKSELTEMTNMGFKTLSDELNIDDVNDQLSKVQGLGFSVGHYSTRPQPIRGNMQGPLRIEDVNESVASITNGMDGLFENKHKSEKKTLKEDSDVLADTDLENLIGITRGFCTSGKFRKFVEQAKKEILREAGLTGKEKMRRDRDGVSEVDWLIEKMIGEYLIDQRIAF